MQTSLSRLAGTHPGCPLLRECRLVQETVPCGSKFAFT